MNRAEEEALLGRGPLRRALLTVPPPQALRKQLGLPRLPRLTPDPRSQSQARRSVMRRGEETSAEDRRQGWGVARGWCPLGRRWGSPPSQIGKAPASPSFPVSPGILDWKQKQPLDHERTLAIPCLKPHRRVASFWRNSEAIKIKWESVFFFYALMPHLSWSFQHQKALFGISSPQRLS